MADINKYLDGLNMKFSEQEKQLLDIFAECWEYCHTHVCKECEYRQGNEHMKIMLCLSYQYAKRLIAADVVPVKHGEWTTIDGISRCSECGYISLYDNAIDDLSYSDYCPDCGTRMDGDADANGNDNKTPKT